MSLIAPVLAELKMIVAVVNSDVDLQWYKVPSCFQPLKGCPVLHVIKGE
jgi:hypothetical protein